MNYDAIVVGLGAMGAATLSELARRGMSVLGLEAQSTVGHDRGSSYGHSRVIRKAYFEHPSYVPLILRSYQRWLELEEEVGESLLVRTGCLNLGPPDGELLAGVVASVTEHELAHERLDADEVRRRFPALRPAPGDIGIYGDDGGLLQPERCVRALVESAKRQGAEVRLGASVRSVGHGSVCIEDERIEADHIVVTTGAWLSKLVPVYAARLEVMRQVQLWFEPDDPTPFEVGRLPCFIHAVGDRAFYGLPRHGGRGVKVCRHYGGVTVDPDQLDRIVNDADEAVVRGWLRSHMPGADTSRSDGVVCMYTNTPDEHFVLGPHPELAEVWVAGGGSGHAFKLAPAIGEALAELVTTGGCAHDIALFDPSRFE